MNSNAIATFFLVSSLLFGGSTWGNQASEQGDRSTKSSRKEQLIDLLKKRPDAPFPGSITFRAAEELSLRKDLTSEDLQVLLRAIKDGVEGTRGAHSFQSTRFLRAVAAAGSNAVQPIRERLLSRDASLEEKVGLLQILAVIGPPAKGAVPVLREIVENPKDATSMGTTARIALANIVGASKEESQLILADIRNPDARRTVYQVFLRAPPRQWLTNEMLSTFTEELTTWLDKTGGKGFVRVEFQVMSSTRFLGHMGPSAKTALPLLRKLSECAIAEKSPLAVTLGPAMARIDPDNASGYLRPLLKHLSQIASENTFGTAIVLGEWPYLLVDSKLSHELARLAAGKDAETATAAQIMLQSAGLAAADSFPVLLRLVRESKDGELRKKLAALLPSVAEYSKLESLEAFARVPENADIREILERRVRAIRLLQDDD